MTAAEAASTAFLLTLLEIKDNGGTDADVYETLTLFALECLAMIAGADPQFNSLLLGLGAYAKLRSVEGIRAAVSGQRPSPLSEFLSLSTMH